MTVKELIDKLKKCSPDATVYDTVASEVQRVRVFDAVFGNVETYVVID